MKSFFYLLFLLQVFVSCKETNNNFLAGDIELWRDTEIWNFAKCISNEEYEKAEQLINNNLFDVDFREPKYGETLLSWAVWNDNIDAVKFLVEHGANPNAHNTYDGLSPVTDASGGHNSTLILDYLLRHGGNPNDYVKENEVLTYGRSYETPLIKAAFVSIEKTKLLTNAGADANFAVKAGYTPLSQAALGTTMDVLEYLLYNCKIDYKKTYIVTMDTQDTLYLKDIIKTNNVVYQQDSIKVKRILDYIDRHVLNLSNGNRGTGF
jgi:hypothetical protein